MHSNWLPGPIAIHFNRNTMMDDRRFGEPLFSRMRPDVGVPRSDSESQLAESPQTVKAYSASFSEQLLLKATNLYRNSLRRLVIGPAIKSDYDNASMVRAIKGWVQKLGLGFLIPMTRDGADLKGTLETLRPSTDFEREVVDCLREVIR